MANDPSKQSFLNTLFQWTVKSTAEEASSTTPSNVEPMDEEVKILFISNHNLK